MEQGNPVPREDTNQAWTMRWLDRPFEKNSNVTTVQANGSPISKLPALIGEY